jgi:hypothetical protein
VKRHEVDVASLVLGLFFLGVAAIWGLSDVPQHPRHGWWFPLLLIAIGAVGLVASLTGRRSPAGPAGPEPVGPEPVGPEPVGPVQDSSRDG